MINHDGAEGGYYRAIARDFLRRRGAPYFLSPRDLALIAEWEERQIPLAAVLEGISAAFERRRGRPGRDKIAALSFCASAVEAAHSQHLDRRAGRRRAVAPRAEKRALARSEAERFLGSLATNESVLRAIYELGVSRLGADKPDEDVLEDLDEQVDGILWASAAPEEVEKCRRTARREFGGQTNLDLEGISRSLAVRAARERRKIPYLSLFYY
jgi:hypothetical protein